MDVHLCGARLYLVRLRPYITYAAMALIPVESKKVPVTAVDTRWRLYYNPESIQEFSIKQLAAIIYHEIWHLLHDHAARGKQLNADPVLWNIATDLAINDAISQEQEISLPDGALLPAMFNLCPKSTAENYYELLKKKLRFLEMISAGTTGGDQGSEGDVDVTEPINGLKGNAKSLTAQNRAPTRGRCGSCATGVKESWELDAGGESDSVKGLTDIEVEHIKRIVASEIVASRGSVPGRWVYWAESYLKPSVDWRRELASSIRHATSHVRGGMTDYSYRRPSRRQFAIPDVVLPSMVEYTPEIAIVIDTSRSIEDAELDQFLAEVRGILRGMGIHHVTVLSVDAAVHFCKKVFSTEQIALIGRGGTDMRVGIAAALELKPRPDVIIVFTDGITPWPERAPSRSRVVVALIGDRSEGIPSWAKLVRIGNSK